MSYYIYIKFPLEITIINIISSFSLHNITSEKRPIPLGRFLYKKQDYEMVGSRGLFEPILRREAGTYQRFTEMVC